MKPSKSSQRFLWTANGRPPAGQNARAFGITVAALVLAFMPAPRLDAAETGARSPVDGTWKWRFTMRDGGRIEAKAKLKQMGQTVTGVSLLRAGLEAPIQDGSISNDTVQWSVVREHDGRKVTTRYQGKLEGDTLKGFIDSDWTGEVHRYDWEAKREPDTPAGTWRWAWSSGGGRRPAADTTARSGDSRDSAGADRQSRRGREAKGTFKLDGERVTGKIAVSGRELEVRHGRFRQGEVSFQIVRERGGERVLTSYRGVIEGDTIKGRTESESGGEKHTRPWEATRIED